MKTVKKDVSLHIKLIFATLASLLTFIFLSTFVWHTKLTEHAKTESVSNLQTIIEITDRNLELLIQDINDITLLISKDPNLVLKNQIRGFLNRDPKSVTELLSTRNVAEDTLTSLVIFKEYVKSLTVYDTQGIAATYGRCMQAQHVVEQKWFRDVLDGKKNFIVLSPYLKAVYTFYSPNLVFSIVRPIYSGREIVGVVKADIDSSLLNNLVDVNKSNVYSNYVINETLEHIIFPLVQPEGFDEAGLLKIPQEAERSEKTYLTTVIEGMEYIAVTKKSPTTNWTMIALAPVESLTGSFSAAVHDVIVLIFVIGVLLSVVVYLLTNKMTKDLRILSDAVSSIDRGNMKLEVAIKSNDEVGRLYKQMKYMLKRIDELISNIQNTERLKRKLEVSALQNQIKPHFIHNTLNTIKYLAKLNNTDNILEVSEYFSEILQITFDARSYIHVAEEVDYLKSYLSIQEFLYSGKFKAEFTIDEVAAQELVPKLLLQPIVENALQYGIAPKNALGIIQISIHKHGEQLEIVIQDNGVGMHASHIEEILHKSFKSDHIGMKNTKDRLLLLYGETAEFLVESKHDVFTRVKMTFPLKPLTYEVES